MAVQFTRAGNFLARVLKVKPTGEKHKTTWRPKRKVAISERMKDLESSSGRDSLDAS